LTANNGAGIHVHFNSRININSVDGTRNHTLTARGGQNGAGIGGYAAGDGYGRHITIESGTIIASNSGGNGAGIGGGGSTAVGSAAGNTGTIIIRGSADVTATGGGMGAGIGGGNSSGGVSGGLGTITIEGSTTVTATAGNNLATGGRAIGRGGTSGTPRAEPTITITGSYNWTTNSDNNATSANLRNSTSAHTFGPAATTAFPAPCGRDIVNLKYINLHSTQFAPGVQTPNITTQPQNQTVVQGDPVTLSVTATVTDGTLSYQWQMAPGTTGGSFSNISGATSNPYIFTPTDSGTNRYRVVVTNTHPLGGTADRNSDAATITVRPAIIVGGTTVTLDGPATASGTGWSYAFSSNVHTFTITGTNVTVSGTTTAPILQRFQFNIEGGATVNWNANLTGTVSTAFPFVTVSKTGDSPNNGTFNMTGGSINNTSLVVGMRALRINNGIVGNVSGGSFTVNNIPTFPITFNPNGGATVGADVLHIMTTTSGGFVSLPNINPTRDGYVFYGWFTAQTGGQQVDASANFHTTFSTARTVYARWAYTVTFNLNYTGAGAPPAQQPVQNGGSITLPDEPTRTGYRFIGWFDTAEATGGNQYTATSANVTANVTLYARWQPVRRKPSR